MKKGLVLTNALLAAEKDAALFEKALDVLCGYDLQAVEFYTDETRARQYGKLVAERGFEPVFITALDQKRSDFCRICAEDEELRKRSVEFSKRSIDKAVEAGASFTLLQSGKYPAEPALECEAVEALIRSLEELADYAGDAVKLTIEPCDRAVDICQLMGPSMETYTVMRRLKKPVGLTMDVAHLAELCEEPVAAITLCKPWCSHVHIANTVLDRRSPLFGDKHPLFGVDMGMYSDAEGQKIFNDVKALYGDDPLLVSMEMIGREGDPLTFLHKLLDSAPWFFARK